MSLEEEFQEIQTLAEKVDALSSLVERAAANLSKQADLILRLTRNQVFLQQRLEELEVRMDDQSDN